MPNEAVAAYLRAVREGRNLTQEELAQATEVSKRTIERFERNEGDIVADHLARIIAALGQTRCTISGPTRPQRSRKPAILHAPCSTQPARRRRSGDAFRPRPSAHEPTSASFGKARVFRGRC